MPHVLIGGLRWLVRAGTCPTGNLTQDEGMAHTESQAGTQIGQVTTGIEGGITRLPDHRDLM